MINIIILITSIWCIFYVCINWNEKEPKEDEFTEL